jgi:hypothetical protein
LKKKTKWKIPLYKIFTDGEDNRAVNKVLQRGIDWAIGHEITEFEKKIANYIGTKYCITFNSGTSTGLKDKPVLIPKIFPDFLLHSWIVNNTSSANPAALIITIFIGF